jgi:hypothetical protein
MSIVLPLLITVQLLLLNVQPLLLTVQLLLDVPPLLLNCPANSYPFNKSFSAQGQIIESNCTYDSLTTYIDY